MHSGYVRNIDGSFSNGGVAIFQNAEKVFQTNDFKNWSIQGKNTAGYCHSVDFSVNRVVPTAPENRPISMSLYPCIRVL